MTTITTIIQSMAATGSCCACIAMTTNTSGSWRHTRAIPLTTMVKAITQVSGVMGMKTIAEFVETGESFELLKDMGVDYAQGYWIEKPRPVAEVFPVDESCDKHTLHLVSGN